MSLSPGQAAILRALGEGANDVYLIAGATKLTPWQVNACLSYPDGACSTIGTMPEGLIDGFMHTWTRTTYALTDRGREALRALEQEAAG